MIGPKTAKRRSAFRRANRAMPRRRIDIAIEAIDYKNPDLLKKFVTESGKIQAQPLCAVDEVTNLAGAKFVVPNEVEGSLGCHPRVDH
jgi:ribosomal protein S18